MWWTILPLNYSNRPDATRAQQLGWDYRKLTAQIAFEDSFRAIAEASGKPTVILCDRGAMDTKAFCSTEDEVDADGDADGDADDDGLMTTIATMTTMMLLMMSTMTAWRDARRRL